MLSTFRCLMYVNIMEYADIFGAAFGLMWCVDIVVSNLTSASIRLHSADRVLRALVLFEAYLRFFTWKKVFEQLCKSRVAALHMYYIQ